MSVQSLRLPACRCRPAPAPLAPRSASQALHCPLHCPARAFALCSALPVCLPPAPRLCLNALCINEPESRAQKSNPQTKRGRSGEPSRGEQSRPGLRRADVPSALLGVRRAGERANARLRDARRRCGVALDGGDGGGLGDQGRAREEEGGGNQGMSQRPATFNESE